MQDFLLQVDVAEIVVHEADDPNPLVDLLDANALTSQDVGDTDAFGLRIAVPADLRPHVDRRELIRPWEPPISRMQLRLRWCLRPGQCDGFPDCETH